MSPSTAELARALVASPRWEWRAGMRTMPWSSEDTDVIRVLRTVEIEPGYTVGHGVNERTGRGALDTEASDVPDLDDPATAGVLLGMLLEAKPCGTRWSGPVVPEHEQHVSMYVGDHREYFAGPTLGVAVARALLSTWEAK